MHKKNIPLIVGIALPFVLIAVLAAIVYIPSLFVNPSHNFVYTYEDRYYYDGSYDTRYEVENGKIVVKDIPRLQSEEMKVTEDVVHKGNPPLYMYDVKHHTTHKITLEEAQAMMLDPGPSSPDGYSVEYRYGHDGIFEIFGSSGNSSDYYLIKGSWQ